MSEQNDKKVDWKKNEVGALWKKTSIKTGKSYLEGTIDGKRVIGFFNDPKTKKNENQPDFKIYLKTDSDSPTPSAKQEKSTKEPRDQKPQQQNDDDDVMF